MVLILQNQNCLYQNYFLRFTAGVMVCRVMYKLLFQVFRNVLSHDGINTYATFVPLGLYRYFEIKEKYQILESNTTWRSQNYLSNRRITSKQTKISSRIITCGDRLVGIRYIRYNQKNWIHRVST